MNLTAVNLFTLDANINGNEELSKERSEEHSPAGRR